MKLHKQLIGLYILRKPKTNQEKRDLLPQYYLLVEQYWKGFINEDLPKVKLKEIIDNCFLEWDLFVLWLYKNDIKTANICYNNSYKAAFMNNKEMKAAYDRLKLETYN